MQLPPFVGSLVAHCQCCGCSVTGSLGAAVPQHSGRPQTPSRGEAMPGLCRVLTSDGSRASSDVEENWNTVCV
eukprot:1831475-Rhodomonas_salina.1